jgi:hypothetical protein
MLAPKNNLDHICFKKPPRKSLLCVVIWNSCFFLYFGRGSGRPAFRACFFRHLGKTLENRFWLFFSLVTRMLAPSVRTTTGIYLQSTFGDVLDSKGATLRTERKHKQRFQTQQNARNHQATQTNNTYSSKHKTVYKQKM